MGRRRRKRRETQIREIAVDRSDCPGKMIRAELRVTFRRLIAGGMAEKAGDLPDGQALGRRLARGHSLADEVSVESTEGQHRDVT
jgi:hypothetical protein